MTETVNPTGELTLDQNEAYTKGMASLYAKKAQVMGLLQPVAKDGKDATKGFSYMTASAVKHMVQQAMAKAGLSLSISLMDVTIDIHEKGRRTIAKFAISLCDGTTGATETSVWMGIGSDTYNDDKGFNKASTSALKYFLSATFLVASEDDVPETGNSAPSNGARSTRPAPSNPPKPPVPANTPQPPAGPAASNGTPKATQTSTDAEAVDWAIHAGMLKWAWDTLRVPKEGVPVALKATGRPVTALTKDEAKSAVLASAAGYQNAAIQELGAKHQLSQEVIADALLIPSPIASS